MLISTIGVACVLSWNTLNISSPTPSYKHVLSAKQDSVITFEKGDILIRSNTNYLPGTSKVLSGHIFGHAAIVVQRGEGKSIDEALNKSIIVEAIMFDQANRSFEFDTKKQVRKVPAKISFGKRFSGIRYRLRTKLTNKQKEMICQFLNYQIGTHPYNPFSIKNTNLALSISKNKYYLLNKKEWNCTTLCWFAFMNVVKIDVDSNKGLLVYPNDIIQSKYFNEDNGRIRF